MEAAKQFPALKWAQDAKSVLMTIDIADVKADTVQIDINDEEQKLIFSASTEDKKFAFDMVMFEQVVKADSKWNLKGRNITLYISKKD